VTHSIFVVRAATLLPAPLVAAVLRGRIDDGEIELPRIVL